MVDFPLRQFNGACSNSNKNMHWLPNSKELFGIIKTFKKPLMVLRRQKAFKMHVIHFGGEKK